MPYQFEPSAANVNMSKRFATAVMVGAVLPTNLTPVNVAVLVPAPVFKNKINDLPAVLLGIVNVHVADKLAVMIVLFAIFKVNALPVFTYPVVIPSVYALNCELTNVELLIVTPLADPLIIVTFVLVNPLAVPPLMVTLLNVDALEVTLFMLPLVMLTFVNVSAFAVPPVIVTLPNDETYVITSLMFILSLNTIVLLPAGRVNDVPVGEALLPLEIMTELDNVFVIKYCFSIAGTNNV